MFGISSAKCNFVFEVLSVFVSGVVIVRVVQGVRSS